MTYHLLYETAPHHTRAALFDKAGRLLTLRYEDATRQHIEGAIIWGRVESIASGLGSAFVDVGDQHPGILPLSTLATGEKLTQGQKILVRITRGGFAEKGPRLDARVAAKPPAPDTKAPTLIKPAPPAIVRALHDANQHPVTVWVPDARLRDTVRQHVPERAIHQLNDGSEGAENLIETLESALDAILSAKPTFGFTAGREKGDLIAEITSAVATIDVNSPLATANGTARADAILATNLAAAEEVVRLARLLDLGGSLIIDFITPKSKSHRTMITEHLMASFATADETDVEIRPMSRHGLVELNRTRTGPSLPLLLAEPSFVAGRILLQLWRHAPGTLPKMRKRTLTCHPAVAAILKTRLPDATCLAHLGYTIAIIEEPLLQPTAYRLSDN